MRWNPLLVLELLAALALAQCGLWLLARLLGKRLRLEQVVAGWVLPVAVLLPWIGGNLLLAPTQILAGQVPGTMAPKALEAHAAELNDAIFQFLPWELEVRHALSAGRLPFWSNLVDGGSTLWANPQAAVLSPIAIDARLLPIQHHLLAALALKMLVALQGAALLAASLGMRRGTSLVVGVSYALSGAIFAWALFPHSAAAAWAPWCVLASLIVARGPRLAAASRRRRFGMSAPRGGFVGAVLAFVALLLSGQPEVAASAAALSLLVAAWFRRRGALARALARCTLVVTLGFGLAAPAMVPFLALLLHSQRAGEHLARNSPPAEAAPGSEEGAWFAQGKDKMLRAPASPLAFGKPYQEPFQGAVGWTISETLYAGLAAFLGVVTVLFTRRRIWAAPLLAFAALALLLAADFRPLVGVWFLLPPLRLPEYARFLPVAALALALAGGMGLEAIAGRRRIAVLAATGAACALSLAAAPRVEVLLAWALLLAAAVIGVRRWAVIALLCGALVDLVPWARWMLPPGDPALFYPRTPELEEAARATPPEYRAVGQEYLSYPSVLPFFGIAEFRAHNPLAPNDYLGVLDAAFGFSPTTLEYFSPLRQLGHPLRRFLGVRIIVSNQYLEPPPAATLLAEPPDKSVRLYRDEKALPRVFATASVDTIQRQDIDGWIANMTQPRRVAVFAEELGDWPLPPSFLEPKVEIERLEAGAITVRLPPEGAKLLATSIPGPRGWRAWSGERPLRTLTVNGAFLGVVVPRRLETIQMRYRPPGLVVGVFAALMTVLVLMAVAVAPARWLTKQSIWRAGLWTALTGSVLALVVATNAVAVRQRRAAPNAYPRESDRWAWGTPPAEAMRALMAAADPLLPKENCAVGISGPWEGERALFPPLWAAYFLPRCDVVPIAAPDSPGLELRIVAGDAPKSERLAKVADLPGGGLYRWRP